MGSCSQRNENGYKSFKVFIKSTHHGLKYLKFNFKYLLNCVVWGCCNAPILLQQEMHFYL